MENWSIKPLVSVGDIAIGMDREKLHATLNRKYKEFKKNKFSRNSSDDYGSFHIYYDVANRVEAVEFFKGVKIAVNGSVIMPASITEVMKVLPDLTEDCGMYVSLKNSIGITAPEGIVESVLVGAKDYYSE